MKALAGPDEEPVTKVIKVPVPAAPCSSCAKKEDAGDDGEKAGKKAGKEAKKAVEKAQQTPRPAGVLQGGESPQKSEPDQVWDRIMNVGNRSKLVK